MSSHGRPRFRPGNGHFLTAGGIEIQRTVTDIPESKVDATFQSLARNLDSSNGCLFESDYEFPGRYARWSMGFNNPPIKLEGYALSRRVVISSLNRRGEVLMPLFNAILKKCTAVSMAKSHEEISSASSNKKRKTRESSHRITSLEVIVKDVEGTFSEEERSKQNSVFSVVREIISYFAIDPHIEPQLGLYGAFGYDLTFQFDKVKLKHDRNDSQRDIVLYLPDEIIVQDNQLKKAWKLQYDFTLPKDLPASTVLRTTKGLTREGHHHVFRFPTVDDLVGFKERDHEPGEYADSVIKAKQQFKCGNLFEVVLSQTFKQPLDEKANVTPSELYRRIRIRNPSPYMFLINLGEEEYLVGASPEMFVRAERDEKLELMIETCPISGTIQRGKHALEDAERIKEILSNEKEESELTMCTDVDRNDKSRICKEGSVQVVGRRQIEKYSKLIHTVDHVQGILREGFDALDAFLVHTWAVTVTGAPKTWAMNFVEANEKSPRKWYGGAVGLIGFDGNLNTGLTLRTIRVKNGVGEVRAGATLLFDSDPMSEEKETELKASAFRDILLPVFKNDLAINGNGFHRVEDEQNHKAKSVLVIDHEDSFVNTLSNYVRQLGVQVTTMRYSVVTKDVLANLKPDLALLSPGPGCPKDFDIKYRLDILADLKIPVFGVCLGLQGIIEYFGGNLKTLAYPMHGKPSNIFQTQFGKENIFKGLAQEFKVGRYHSLYADKATFPQVLEIIAVTSDADGEIVMGIQHKVLPIAAVQFHPESIMTNPEIGLQILENVMEMLKY